MMAFIFCLVQKNIGKSVKKGMEKLRAKLGNLNAYTGEVINNVQSVQSSGYSKLAIKRFNIFHQEYMNQYLSQAKIMSVNQIFGLSFNIIGLCIVLCVGSYKVFYDNLTVGQLFSLTVYVQRLYSPIVALGNLYLSIKNSVPIIDRLEQIMITGDIMEEGDIEYQENLRGEIEFCNVGFRYEDKQILNDFSIQIKAGKTIGICGINGSGKSTIIKLLTRLCNAKEGKILIDGTDIKKYKREYYQSQISCMSQGSFIMSGKLRTMLNPFDKDISDKKLVNYMERMRLNIHNFENGLDTYIGENGITLSGGEKQKISLIRILIDDKPIVVLDEPTSAIDIESEIHICKELKLFLKEKTTIIVTHRTTILDICDQVIYL
jgi:ABC-type multidrug transport system fused ATPase/permease subunit